MTVSEEVFPAHMSHIPITYKMWLYHIPVDKRDALRREVADEDPGFSVDLVWESFLTTQERLDLLEQYNAYDYSEAIRELNRKEVKCLISRACLKATPEKHYDIAAEIVSKYGNDKDEQLIELVRELRS